MKHSVFDKKEFTTINGKTKAIFVFAVLIFVRFALSNRLPSYILSDMPHDDAWVVNHASNILNGNWLGSYDQYTLIKGVFSPLLLAFSTGIGVSFSGLNTALYCFACIVFLVSVRPIIRNQWLQTLCFILLLFNPITYALDTGQRIYRNGIGQWEILLIFGCLIGMFLRRHDNWKGLLKWVLLCGLGLGAFIQTREDAAWIYPFILGAIITIVIVFLLEKIEPKKKIILFILPIVIALILSGVIAIANYIFYGVPILNDRSYGNYAKVAGDLNLITPDNFEAQLYDSEVFKNRYYNIYVSSMEKAFTFSPTLNSAAQPIRDAIRIWASWEDSNNGQLSSDKMLFALRDGVKSAGYYETLPKAEAFYKKVHEELKAAFDSGRLIKRGFLISPLIVPLQDGDLRNAFSFMPGAIINIAQFNNVSSEAIPAKGSEAGIEKFGLMAGGDYFTSQNRLFVSGWAFAEDNNIHLTGGFYDNHGVMIAILPFNPGEDVFKEFKYKYQNAKMSRFSFKINGYDLKSGSTLRFFGKNGDFFWEIPLDGSATCGDQNGSFHFCIDNLKTDSYSEKFYSHFVHRANNVIAVYQKLIPLVSIIAFFSYLAATALLVCEFLKKQTLRTLPVWLILTGVGLTFILFIFFMCLITTRSFYALGYIYTAPAYILLLIFCVVSTCWAAEGIFEI